MYYFLEYSGIINESLVLKKLKKLNIRNETIPINLKLRTYRYGFAL